MAAEGPERFIIAVLGSAVPLSRDANLRLLAAAQALFASHSRQMDLESSDKFSGSISTDWEHQSLGSFSGPAFSAFVDMGSHRGLVRFIVPEHWLAADLNPEHLLFSRFHSH